MAHDHRMVGNRGLEPGRQVVIMEAALTITIGTMGGPRYIARLSAHEEQSQDIRELHRQPFPTEQRVTHDHRTVGNRGLEPGNR